MKYEQKVQVETSEYICLVKRIDGVVAQKTLESELIRCKDCKYNNGGRCGWHGGAGYKWVVDDDDFCSCGVRDDDGTERS